jgi:hypothetical protein
MGKNEDPEPGSGSGMNILDHISESLETIFWVKIVKILKFFDADPGIFLTRDGKNWDPGQTSLIRNAGLEYT